VQEVETAVCIPLEQMCIKSCVLKILIIVTLLGFVIYKSLKEKH